MESEANFGHFRPHLTPENDSKDHDKIWLVHLHRNDKVSLLRQCWWWLNLVVAEESKKSLKRTFGAIFDFVTSWFALGNNSKISKPQLHEHMWQESTCQIWCSFNWPSSTECPQSQLKYWFMRVFIKKLFLRRHRMMTQFPGHFKGGNLKKNVHYLIIFWNLLPFYYSINYAE